MPPQFIYATARHGFPWFEAWNSERPECVVGEGVEEPDFAKVTPPDTVAILNSKNGEIVYSPPTCGLF